MLSTHWKKSSLINSYKYVHFFKIKDPGQLCPICKKISSGYWVSIVYPTLIDNVHFLSPKYLIFQKSTNSVCLNDFVNIFKRNKIKNLWFAHTNEQCLDQIILQLDK